MVGHFRHSLLVLTLALAGAGLIGACATGAGRGAAAPVAEVAERWVSPSRPDANIDSLALFTAGGWLLATAKTADAVLVIDAATGRIVRTAGAPGAAPGQLERPNGIAIAGDLAFVVERDNRRVQVFRLPEMTPVGTFGGGELRRPYGIAVAAGPASYRVWVTDNYETAAGGVPPDGELGARVREYDVAVAAGGLTARAVRAFGDTAGPGALRVVESIAVDTARTRLLVAEEAAAGRGIKVYDFDGRFAGTVMGSGRFAAEPEGIQLMACGDGGYWVTTDQRRRRTEFHLFARDTLAYAGTFSGRLVANTDGIAVAPAPLPGFPEGAVFAVHDDASVAAFSWAEVRAALRLGPPCAVTGTAAPVP